MWKYSSEKLLCTNIAMIIDKVIRTQKPQKKIAHAILRKTAQLWHVNCSTFLSYMREKACIHQVYIYLYMHYLEVWQLQKCDTSVSWILNLKNMVSNENLKSMIQTHTLQVWCSHLINGNPECTLRAYSSYSEPKNCLKKNSSYLLWVKEPHGGKGTDFTLFTEMVIFSRWWKQLELRRGWKGQ